MHMNVGIGFSSHPDAAQTGNEAAAQAIGLSGSPVLTIVFMAGINDPQSALKAIQGLVGTSKLIGFCCGGILVNDQLHSQGLGVCTLAGNILVETTLQGGLDTDPLETGGKAADALQASGISEGTVIALPDGMQANLTTMLQGLYNRMGTRFQYVGGGAGDSQPEFQTYQFTETGCARNAIAAAVLGNVDVATRTGHGWEPSGDPLVMTRTQGKTVFEINGMPAFKTYSKHLGNISREEFPTQGTLHPLGFPDVFGQYIIRDPLAVNEDDSIEFVTEVPSQAVGHIMNGRIDQLLDTAARTASEAVRSISSPAFVLLFDCISRARLMDSRFLTELRCIRQAIGPGIPILGALTFGEIGAFNDVPLFHNKSTVVVAGGELPE